MPEDKKEEKNADEEIQEELKEVKEVKKDDIEVEEIRERLLRLAAEFDNYKKRVAKEIDNAKAFGKAEFAAKLLPILDEFELAMGSLDMKTENGKGIAIVLSNFIDVMKKEGLEEIEAKGLYDPYKHEIMMVKESEHKDGTILDVVRKGYIMNGIMLRPASIIVSKGDAEKEKTNKE